MRSVRILRQQMYTCDPPVFNKIRASTESIRIRCRTSQVPESYAWGFTGYRGLCNGFAKQWYSTTQSRSDPKLAPLTILPSQGDVENHAGVTEPNRDGQSKVLYVHSTLCALDDLPAAWFR